MLGYIDLRAKLIRGPIPQFTCLVGTMVQETYGSAPAIAKACYESIFDHAEKLVDDIEEAKRLRVPAAKWTAKSLALHTQAVLQGAFILAKAKGNADVAIDSVFHLKHYIELLFAQPKPKRKE